MHPRTHRDVHTETGVGTNVATPPLQHLGLLRSMYLTNIPIIDSITPLVANVNEPFGQHTTKNAQNVWDEPTISKVQAYFVGYSHVASMGKLPVTFLVNEYAIPIKMEKLLGI